MWSQSRVKNCGGPTVFRREYSIYSDLRVVVKACDVGLSKKVDLIPVVVYNFNTCKILLHQHLAKFCSGGSHPAEKT